MNRWPIELLGLDDAHIDRQDSRAMPRSAPERFGLAVMHSPDSAPESAACGYELILAGHTHGGQVRLPLVGALVTNSAMPRRLAGGLIRMGSAVMFLSPGLGTSKYAPFRFLCRPEATLLQLGRRSADRRRRAGCGKRQPASAAMTSAKTRSYAPTMASLENSRRTRSRQAAGSIEWGTASSSAARSA